jgi:hypothetical protein
MAAFLSKRRYAEIKEVLEQEMGQEAARRVLVRLTEIMQYDPQKSTYTPAQAKRIMEYRLRKAHARSPTGTTAALHAEESSECTSGAQAFVVDAAVGGIASRCSAGDTATAFRGIAYTGDMDNAPSQSS